MMSYTIYLPITGICYIVAGMTEHVGFHCFSLILHLLQKKKKKKKLNVQMDAKKRFQDLIRQRKFSYA
jgi:phage-related protein